MDVINKSSILQLGSNLSGLYTNKISQESKFKSDDPMASLIMDVEDPQEELNIQQEQLMSTPLKNITEVSKGDMTMPENIDYSQHMERLIPE